VADTITVTYKIKEDGSLAAIGKDAEKTAAATDKATKSQSKFNKGQKGVAGATSNSTKAFSKMRSEMGGSSGVVAAYATFAANVFALTAAFGALQRAAQLKNLEEGFERLGNAVGRTSTMMAASIQSITDGAISFDQAMRTAATGFSAGFSTSELEGLAGVARGAATALGRDLPDALDRLVRGTAKLEPEILDELGIFIKIDDAARKYADTLGKSANSLTATQRRQAFLNEALTQGEKKFGAIADTVPVNTYDKLAANFDKLAKSALNLFSTVLSPVIGFLANNTAALLGTLVLFGSTLASSMFPALEQMAEKQLHVAKTTKVMADEEAKRARKTAVTAKREFTKGPSIATTTDGKEFKAIAALKSSLKKGKDSSKEFDKAIASLNTTMKRTATLAKKNGKTLDKEHTDRMAQLEAQKQKILDVQKAQQGGGLSSAKASFLGSEASAQEGVGQALDKIRGQGAGQGFKTATQEFTKFKDTTKNGYDELKTSQKGFAKFGTTLMRGFKLGGAGARLFGAALVNAIPFIGQIIFIAGLAIEAMKALFNAFNKPTKAEKQLAEITENLKNKTEQLAETNEGLEASYLRINLDRGIREGKELTDQFVAQAAAAAKTRAEIQSYANELSVAAGVLDEFSASVGNLANEIAEQSSEGGVFQNLGNWASDELESAGNFFSAIGDSVVSGIKDAGNFIADKAGAVSDGVSDAFVAGVSLVNDDYARNVEFSGVKAKMDTFSTEVSASFAQIAEGLDEAGIADLVEKSFGGTSFDEYIAAQMRTVDLTGTVEDANASLTVVMKRVQGEVAKTSREMQRGSDAINKFEENVKDGASALRLFATKAKESNEFTVLGDNLKGVSEAVKELAILGSAEGAEFDFMTLLDQQVKDGKINLDEFGTTVEQVAANVADGKDPFEQLKNKIAEAADETENGKAKLAALKDELKSLKQAFDFKQATKVFNDSLETLKKTGKFEVSGAQAYINSLPAHKERLAFIKEEQRLNDAIVDQEMRLSLIKVDILAIQNQGNTEILALLKEQREALEGQATAAKAVNKAKADGATLQANSSFLTGQDSRADKTLATSAEGDTTLERFTNFREGGGFKGLEKTDAEGNKLDGEAGENMLGKLEAMQNMTQPMIDNLKSLGPEGELVAAVTEGAFAMGSAFVEMSDTLSTSTNSMEKGAAIAQMASQAFAQIGAMAAASSKAKIAGIDKEIAAEKKRDGTSSASLAKIKAMEKKKEAMKRKEFETNKKMQMGQVVANTAAGIMGVMSGIKDPLITAPLALAQVALIGAMGAAQLATIAGTSFQGGGSIGSTGGAMPSKISIGQRNNTVDLAKSKSASGELAYMRGAEGTGGAGNFRPAFSGYKHRAGGGYVVGEQGPELFMPDVPGEIISSGQNAGGLGNVSFNISTVDATGVEDLLIGQKGNIISMIRDAANSYGESFMDEVDTTVYNKTTEGVSRY